VTSLWRLTSTLANDMYVHSSGWDGSGVDFIEDEKKIAITPVIKQSTDIFSHLMCITCGSSSGAFV
jgi:hypothetical protein